MMVNSGAHTFSAMKGAHFSTYSVSSQPWIIISATGGTSTFSQFLAFYRGILESSRFWAEATKKVSCLTVTISGDLLGWARAWVIAHAARRTRPQNMPSDVFRRRDSHPCVESSIPYTTVENVSIVISLGCVTRGVIKRRSLAAGAPCERLPLQNVTPKLSQVVLLKVTPLTEEAFIGQGFFVTFILQSGEFDTASKVCHLEHPILGWSRIPIYDGIPKEGVLKCHVKDTSDEGLAVIVVDLGEIEFGELIEVIKQELGQVTLHGANELIRRLESILSIDKGVVAERSMLRERTKGHEELGAQRRIEVPVLLVCPEKRVEVEGDVWETSARERLLVQIDRVGEIVALVMKDQGEQVVLGFSSEVAGFIYKDGELLHETSPLDTKSAGGTPRPLMAPSCEATSSLIPQDEALNRLYANQSTSSS